MLALVADALRVKLSHLGFRVPAFVWQRVVAREARGVGRVMASLEPEERRVRQWVVTALGDRGQPLEPQSIAAALSLPEESVHRALDRLEKKKLFVVRNDRGAVSWAYPVTVDSTPHHLSFESGERMNAA